MDALLLTCHVSSSGHITSLHICLQICKVVAALGHPQGPLQL